jgi:surface protein
MFSGYSSLKELNLSNFNTNNVTNMKGMFSGCSSLKELNLSNFNTNNVTKMSYMFYRCSSLKYLNISNFNTNNVTNMKMMLYGCSEYLINKIKSEEINIKNEAFYINYKEIIDSDENEDIDEYYF